MLILGIRDSYSLFMSINIYSPAEPMKPLGFMLDLNIHV